jgi:hypothetical protein
VKLMEGKAVLIFFNKAEPFMDKIFQRLEVFLLLSI